MITVKQVEDVVVATFVADPSERDALVNGENGRTDGPVKEDDQEELEGVRPQTTP